MNDAHVRESVTLIAGLPPGVAGKTLGYLALFRASKDRGLGWARAKRLLVELAALVGKSHVQRDRNVARPNAARFWAEGMQVICDRPPGKLPLKTHGYLTSIVYDLANEADRAAEKEHIRTEHRHGHRVDDDRTERDFEPVSPEILRQIRRYTQ